ncbi:MAG: diguanylate cyclase [Clostridiaceae bacterium]|nr:diguanylate cyclase [Clostridiaceae bacterium]
MGKMNDEKYISIKTVVIILFIVLTSATVGTIGFIVFSNWLSSSYKVITRMAKEMNNKIFNLVDTFIDIPLYINIVNHGLIENEIVKLDNSTDRERFFVEVLKTNSEDIDSFAYGTETGEYYGARRNENNKIEIIINNTDTNGHSWHYSVTDDLTAGQLLFDAGKFDPRTRDWYISAKEAGKPVFSPVYKHFAKDELVLSASTPVYNSTGEFRGVLTCHITLAKIDSYLRKITKDKNAIAVIIERSSGKLIANSLNAKNYKILEDGTIKRLTIEDIDNKALIKAYKNHEITYDNIFRLKNDKHVLYIMFDYKNHGLDWLLIIATPEKLLASGIIENIKLALILTVLCLILSIIICSKRISKILKPIDNLIDTTIKFAQGDLSPKEINKRNNGIGIRFKFLKNMLHTISTFANNIESKVKERAKELEETIRALKESKDQLHLILDSTDVAIYGVDINGNCTFCNASCLKLLGYSHIDELIGKNMHSIIYRHKDGTPMPLEKCKIYRSYKEGKAIHANDEIFWRADGTYFNVEYHSYPQFKDGKIVGAVVTFTDNTERKKNEDYVKYLSYHDSLTGLYNRMFLSQELERVDTPENLPISIIFGDVNGLKLTNDIFGHAAGDALLKKTAEILKKACREKDTIARVGGDEFTILLPKTKAIDAEKIIRRVKKELSKEQIGAIRCYMSMGYDTKTTEDQDIESVMKNAEDYMYKDKTLNRKIVDSNMLKTIINTLHHRCPREKRHSIRVSDICQKIGRAMKLPETEIVKLKKAGFFHDIGKIVIREELLNKKDKINTLTEEEDKEFLQHVIAGYRILSLFNDTMDLAEPVLAHHEKWNGTGYPKGLKGNEIPKLARIIAVAECYEVLTDTIDGYGYSKDEACEVIKKQSGTNFDPIIVEFFLKAYDNTGAIK